MDGNRGTMRFYAVATFVSCLLSGASNAGGWKDLPSNPVLGSADLGTCFDVNVVTNGPAPYTMYFSWRKHHVIALSRSEDGIHWSQTPEVCLESNPMSGWEDVINRSCTVKKDGLWHMWYTGQVFEDGDWRKGYSKIGYATSTDGVRFTRFRDTPVLVPEMEYERNSVMNPYVEWDDVRSIWRMWYAAGEIYEPNVICYAESRDGLTWNKSRLNPVFSHGERLEWDQDRVGACEVKRLGDGRYVMFYIGYSDVDTARIGCAFSEDGIGGWRRFRGNPLVSPELGTWNGSACYKPSIVQDVVNNRWLLYYNGRNGGPEYIGISIHDGLDLESPSSLPSSTADLLTAYVKRFNTCDSELYTNAIPNNAAADFMMQNCPRFACPDRDVERTYYFRWWVYRKHLRKSPVGEWAVSEFMPDVPWAGYGNTIACPFVHHVLEGRWLRDRGLLEGYIRTMIEKGDMLGSRAYATAPAWCAREFARVTGDYDFAVSLLGRLVGRYESWERGWMARSLSLQAVRNAADYNGPDVKVGFRLERGLFDCVGDREGSEFALSADGARPMVNALMWADATAIAELADRKGDKSLASRYEKRALCLRENVIRRLWNPRVGFFTALSADGRHDDVCELHGYAPYYFRMPLEDRYGAAFAALSDDSGFAAPVGLTFPRRDTPGFSTTVKESCHECQWNGPSWPYATSVALTALSNRLHSNGDGKTREPDVRLFNSLLRQYAWQHRRIRNSPGEDGTVVPWIDENLDPFSGRWISRDVLARRKSSAYVERGKDYNHSTFCDLVISGLMGVMPDEKGLYVDPAFPAEWDYCVLEGICYRGRTIDIRWDRARKEFCVQLDGRAVVRCESPRRVYVSISSIL